MWQLTYFDPTCAAGGSLQASCRSRIDHELLSFPAAISSGSLSLLLLVLLRCASQRARGLDWGQGAIRGLGMAGGRLRAVGARLFALALFPRVRVSSQMQAICMVVLWSMQQASVNFGCPRGTGCLRRQLAL